MSGRRNQEHQAVADSDRRKDPVPESKPGKLTPIGLFICPKQDASAVSSVLGFRPVYPFYFFTEKEQRPRISTRP